MYMKDWLTTIDDYLKMTRRDILKTKGKVTHSQAIEKAHAEYALFKARCKELPTEVEIHFFDTIKTLEQIEDNTIPIRK